MPASMPTALPTAQPNQAPMTGPAYTLDRDIVVYWRLAQNLPGSVDLVTHKPDATGRGTFLLTLTPGDDLAPIQTGSDWVFVLDISGSMQGKYATLADGVSQALGRMRPDDRFRIVLFNDGARELTSGYVNATPASVQEWANRVAAVQPGGGTNVYDGLDLGLRRSDADRPTGIVLVTDGVANVGETSQRAFLARLDKQDVRLFTFIMGNSANRPLLEALTRASNGFARSVSNSDDIVGEILTAASKLTHAALHGVRVDIDGVRVADLTPADPGSLYRGQQLMLLGHYWGDGAADVTLSGEISGKPIAYQTRFDFPARSTQNPELERLWAYDRIRAMQQEMADFGDDADIRQGIVDLAVEYGLVTDHTSMLVVRDEVFDSLGIERRNAKRSEVERAARAQREQLAQQRRVDQAQPMFSGSQPRLGGGGAGALSAWQVVLMLLAAGGVVVGRRAAR
ncbi:MAG: VWA domain-containing protein [Thiohalocapsa sp.]|nr:VWA domain-containing protein [Thiohalocapsa sp.]